MTTSTDTTLLAPTSATLGTNPLYQAVVLLVIGWGLGLLSAPITDWIRRRFEKPRLTRALCADLRWIQNLFALALLGGYMRRGSLNHSILRELRSTLSNSGHAPEPGTALKNVDDLLKKNEQDLAGFQSRLAGELVGTSPSLKTYSMPFLESQLSRLEAYSAETQQRLLAVRTVLEIFNQHAANAARYHFMTYDAGITAANHDAAVANTAQAVDEATAQASRGVLLIAELLRRKEMRYRETKIR